MANGADLIKDWIQYLKNNRIVVGSDPAGNLNYKRNVTSDDLFAFLGRTKLKPDVIQQAIDQVVGSKTAAPPAAPAPPPPPAGSPTALAPSTKPRVKYVPPKPVSEAGPPPASRTLTEDEIRAILELLAAHIAGTTPPVPPPRPPAPGSDPAAEEEKKNEELRRIKETIRNKMTDAQRKTLWRELHNV